LNNALPQIEHGEFAAFFSGKPYGAPSPIEQNTKRTLTLNRPFESVKVELPKRFVHGYLAFPAPPCGFMPATGGHSGCREHPLSCG
jgi:hypothetical protein